MCYTWLEAEPSQLIYLVPVGGGRLQGPAHILLLKQTNEALSVPVKGTAAASLSKMLDLKLTETCLMLYLEVLKMWPISFKAWVTRHRNGQCLWT